jgi:hypothetical protein
MKPRGKKTSASREIALALTWDGSRWSVKALPPKARAFLNGKSQKLSVSSAREMAKLFASDDVRECRICWVPRLKGGPDVLVAPFSTPNRKRMAFQVSKLIHFGDILGVVYQKKHSLNHPSS